MGGFGWWDRVGKSHDLTEAFGARASLGVQKRGRRRAHSPAEIKEVFFFSFSVLHFGRAPNFLPQEDHLGLGISEACRWSRKKTEEGKKPLKKVTRGGTRDGVGRKKLPVS